MSISPIGARNQGTLVTGPAFWEAPKSNVPALQAIATDRTKRYASAEEFAVAMEAYQSRFATSAEEAGMLKKGKLWVG